MAELFEHLAVEDIQSAADVLRPVYDHLNGDDGFVSLEVSPYLAMDTRGTIAEAERLWKDVNRKNLMVKVPATPEGLPAIRHLIGEGISINITLLFSQAVYREVAEAYIAGLEQYVANGGDPSHVASVASFFVSRIDSSVDKQLDEKIARANDPGEKERLSALKGKVAIANAKMAYQDYKRLFVGSRWDKLAAKGANPQRLLWASTGTKNKDYSDVLYVEELIGPNTVNTVPPATLDAFRDHGKTRDSLEEDIDDARHVLEELDRSGISLDAITTELVKDGVKQFADAADKLYGAVAHKRAASLGGSACLDRFVALGREVGVLPGRICCAFRCVGSVAVWSAGWNLMIARCVAWMSSRLTGCPVGMWSARLRALVPVASMVLIASATLSGSVSRTPWKRRRRPCWWTVTGVPLTKLVRQGAGVSTTGV